MEAFLRLEINQTLLLTVSSFKGSYGSGKSVAAQKMLEDFAKGSSSAIIYAITWDPYSLLFAEMEELCCTLRHHVNKNVKIICKSLVDISEDQGSKNLLSLPACLEYLSSLHEDPINLLVEELDPELITKADAEAINNIIDTSESYKNSLITFVLQSINKERVTLTEEDSFNHNINIIDDITSMKVHNLQKTMRHTKEVHEAIDIAQTCISSANNIYVQHSHEDIQLRDQKSMNLSKQRKPKQHNLTTDIVDVVGDSTVVSDSSKSDSPDSVSRDQELDEMKPVLEIHPNIDYLAKIFDTDHSLETNGTRLETSYSFPVNMGCGHNISDEKPCLIRMKPKIRNKNIDSINTLASIFYECLPPRPNRRSLVIINDLKLAELIILALKANIGIDVLEYLHKLKNEFPSSKVKKEVYKEWKDNKKCILVTDSRGACGLQHDKVEIALLLITF